MNKRTHSHLIGRAAGIGAAAAGAFFMVLVGANVAFANPAANPPSGTGAISVSGNNVGIGTSTPLTITNNTELSLYGGWYSGIDLGGNGVSNVVRLSVDGSGNGFLQTGTSGGAENLYLGTASTTRMTILATGNVGIGLTNPAYKLDVSGNANVSGTLTAGAFTGTVSSANVSAGTFGANTGGGNYAFTGNVGIGTTSPTYGKLQINQTSDSITGGLAISNAAVSDVSRIWEDSANKLRISSGGAETSPIILNGGGAGNVGIGTTAQIDQALTVNGNISLGRQSAYNAGTPFSKFVGTMDLNGNPGAGGMYVVQDSAGNNYVQFRVLQANVAYSTPLTINYNGNVGIGTTTPATLLHVSADSGSSQTAIRTQNINTSAVGGAALQMVTGASSNVWQWFARNGSMTAGIANVADYMSIINGGNVGIGTASPGYKLDVQGGQINSSGGYCINGANCITSWPSGSTSQWTTSGSNIYYTAGSVGIGTASPIRTLTDAGEFSMTTSANSYINVSDSAGSNGGNMTLHLRGLGSSGSAEVALSAIYLTANTTYMSGNANVTGTLTAGAFTGALSASNVSAGTFGANTGGGTYAFSGTVTAGTFSDGYTSFTAGQINRSGGTVELQYPGGSGSNVQMFGNTAFPIRMQGSNGYVGIGTASPSYPLEVNGTGMLDGTLILANGAGGYRSSIIPGQTGVSSGNSFTFVNANGTSIVSFAAAGNVGIGATAPAQKLEVNGNVQIDGNYLYTNGSASSYGAVSISGSKNGWTGINFPGSGTLMVNGGTMGFFNAADNGWTFAVDNTGNATVYGNESVNGNATVYGTLAVGGTGIYNNAGYQMLQANATDWMRINQNNSFTNGIAAYGPWSFGTGGVSIGTWNASVGSGNLSVTGKITVGTIDPVYSIDGTNYATYSAGMTGVNEETAGTLTLARATDGTYSTTIDFGAQATGSSLWLFSHATALTDNIDKLVVMLTPSFDGKVWYTKNAASGTVTLYGDQAGEISYRFTAPRFDAVKWANTAPANETPNFTVE